MFVLGWGCGSSPFLQSSPDRTGSPEPGTPPRNLSPLPLDLVRGREIRVPVKPIDERDGPEGSRVHSLRLRVLSVERRRKGFEEGGLRTFSGLPVRDFRGKRKKQGRGSE